MGTYLPGTGTLGWEAWYGAGTPHSRHIPPELLSTTQAYGTSSFLISASLTGLDGCPFFNSVVVRLPFSSISNAPEGWWFYILDVIF